MITASGVVYTATILDAIAARKAEEVAALRTVQGAMAFPLRTTPVRDFGGALRGQTLKLIAEAKRSSPSKGVLVHDYNAARLAASYAEHGAQAVSVLTDHDFFGGSLDDMQAARAIMSLPVIRKDFMIDVIQIQEAYSAGADAILLIVAMLEAPLLHDLYQAARDLGLHVLVETHNVPEMEIALNLNAPIIGINNRDLHTFKVDLGTTERLAAMTPHDTTLVAESGIFTADDVRRMASAGANAILVGESIVRSGDIGGQIRALSGIPAVPRSKA